MKVQEVKVTDLHIGDVTIPYGILMGIHSVQSNWERSVDSEQFCKEYHQLPISIEHVHLEFLNKKTYCYMSDSFDVTHNALDSLSDVPDWYCECEKHPCKHCISNGHTHG